MTLPPKPWQVRYDGSANSLRDKDGNVLCFIPDHFVAEHIVDCCNGIEKALELQEANLNEHHDAEVSKLDAEIARLKQEIEKLTALI